MTGQQHANIAAFFFDDKSAVHFLFALIDWRAPDFAQKDKARFMLPLEMCPEISIEFPPLR